MKITINLSKTEANGIKEYLKFVDDIDKPTKEDVRIYLNTIIGIIHSPREAVSDYIRTEELKNIYNYSK